MAFIYKSAIETTYNNCVNLLDSFDESQLETIHSYIGALNSTGNQYKLGKTPDRVCIFKYLFDLKNNKNETEEPFIWDRFRSIHHAMSAMALLKIRYKENGIIK